jgi:Flp pilus assembly protein TadD
VSSLRRVAGRNPKDVEARVLLAHALTADGRPEEGLTALEDARKMAPADAELLFALGSQYLRVRQPDRAAAVFAELLRARPRAETHVLLGRSYRDYGDLEKAKLELQAALAQSPKVRRARYYLGMITVAEKGRAGLEEAVTLFRDELKQSPDDPLPHLQLGMALVDLQRPREALPSLELARRFGPPDARILYYLGRAQLGADQAAAAVASLGQALDQAQQNKATNAQLRVLHNQLGQALQRAGDTKEAELHFAEASRLSDVDTGDEREKLARFLADTPEPEKPKAVSALPRIDSSTLAGLTAEERAQIKARATAGVARASLNLGVLHAQAGRFTRAAELIEKAAAVEPDFPRVQASLGIAYFNAGRFDKAVGPLGRAAAADRTDPGLRRMLALAYLNTQEYARAAEYLRDDPERGADPSLEFAYGLALVKSGRAAEAEPVYDRLLARHGDSAELSVLVGQANAQMGDFDAAVEALKRALRYKANVPEANATLGVIYLKQGRLPEAEQALRAELGIRPGDLLTQQNLAVTLEMLQRPDEAETLLRACLQAKPDSADARYLLGKILLARGAAAEAAEHLEAAARLSPEDANVRYQLGQAYQRLGRRDQAEREFEAFRELKARR